MAASTSLALMGAGAASGAIGSYYSAKGQQTALRYQADIAEQNARIAELGAQSELLRGQREVQTFKLKKAGLKSSQRAAMAANGIDLGQGSALEIQTSTDLLGEVDANTIEANAIRSAWGYRTQGVNATNDALMKRASANTISPFSAGASSLLGSAGQVASTWYNMNKSGAFASPPKILPGLAGSNWN